MPTIPSINHPRQDHEKYRALPKVDLHRHLEGSLRIKTIAELSRAHALGLPGTNELRDLVQIQEHEPYTFENFLSKFQTLRLFYRSPEIIARIAREAVADAAGDGVRYLELRFTPVALGRAENFPLAEVINWVIEGVEEASRQHHIEVSLIVSVNRHESPALAEQVIGLAVDRRSAGIVGVDLAGNEVHFSALPFASIFKNARQEGLHITIHAGEWGGAENVQEAILELGAERIGHGIRVMDDPRVVEMARETGTVFEVCLTSNLQSGAVASLSAHPLKAMHEAGLRVTLNTDDPSISKIDLSDEYRLAENELGLPDEVFTELLLNGARSSFQSEIKRRRLLQEMEKALSHL
jgi:adenosine deaminase